MGTSRIRKANTETWAFISELTDQRLESYGQMSSARYQNFDGPTITSKAKPISHEPFNAALVTEYEKRNGKIPEWTITEKQQQNRSDTINKK